MFGQVGGVVIPSPESRTQAESTFEPLVEAVRRAIEVGQLRDADPTVVATTMWATLHGLVSLELRGLLPPAAGDASELYRQTMRAMGEGWAARPR
jgi:hypothetical protein